MRRVPIPSRAGVDSDPLSFLIRELAKNAVNQCNKGGQELARWIQLNYQSAFGEIDLYAMRIEFQAIADVASRFID